MLTVALAQISPIWLDKNKTLEKIIDTIDLAAKDQSKLTVFGECLLPGYPFWLDTTHGSKFNDPMQKKMHAHYIKQAVQIESGDLDKLCQKAKQHQMSIYLGCLERAANRGGHSVYCSLVYIDRGGEIKSVHRKLQPTYEERLTWAQGDGHGLVTHSLEEFTVGGLNCWENWMPLPRTALYGLGENLHVAVWPGGIKNTGDITKFLAKEGRSYVMSVSGLMKKSDIPTNIPFYEELLAAAPDEMANGASCIAKPDGEWLIEPQIGVEGVFTAQLDFDLVLQERQNFDPVGHYSRPDVTKLVLNRDRQSILSILSNSDLDSII